MTTAVEPAASPGTPPGPGGGGLAGLVAQVDALRVQVSTLQTQCDAGAILLQEIVKTVRSHAETVAQVAPLTPLIPLVEQFLATTRGRMALAAARMGR